MVKRKRLEPWLLQKPIDLLGIRRLINSSAKRFIYGRKEAERLKAVIAANRVIESANAVTHLYDDDELGPKINPDPTTMSYWW